MPVAHVSDEVKEHIDRLPVTAPQHPVAATFAQMPALTKSSEQPLWNQQTTSGTRTKSTCSVSMLSHKHMMHACRRMNGRRWIFLSKISTRYSEPVPTPLQPPSTPAAYTACRSCSASSSTTANSTPPSPRARSSSQSAQSKHTPPTPPRPASCTSPLPGCDLPSASKHACAQLLYALSGVARIRFRIVTPRMR